MTKMPDDSPESLQRYLTFTTDDAHAWDRYVRSHPHATHYHRYAWRRVIEEAYGHRTLYLAAQRHDDADSLAGVLPLVQLRDPFRGNRLISMPFADTGGILADSPSVEKILLAEALRRGKKVKARTLELRQTAPMAFLEEGSLPSPVTCTIRSHKVSLTRELKGCPDDLWCSFKSKLRSQIRKAEKNGLHTETGGEELLDDFYSVFSRNMRDLGSPVHSRRLFGKVLEHFRDDVHIVVVRRGRKPLAGAFTLGHRDTLMNPWASSLREFRHLASNMLLYWGMLEFASRSRFRVFDFGRSSPAAGTCRFKLQWGANASPLSWHYLSLDGTPPPTETLVFGFWKRLPMPVANLLGPFIRRHIGL